MLTGLVALFDYVFSFYACEVVVVVVAVSVVVAVPVLVVVVKIVVAVVVVVVVVVVVEQISDSVQRRVARSRVVGGRVCVGGVVGEWRVV